MASIDQVIGAVAMHPATAPRTRSPKAFSADVVPCMSGTLRACGPQSANQDQGPPDDENHLGCCVYEIDGRDYLPGDVDDVDPGQPEGAGESQDHHFERGLPSPGGDKESDRDGGNE